jgi:endonuclease/exonuclease/phosphatase family metal-dependent hydrolase
MPSPSAEQQQAVCQARSAMRVLTWNVQHARPNPDGAPDIDVVAASLASVGADVHAVQELDRRRRRSGRQDQPGRLAAALEAELVWAPALTRGGEYGVALIVRGTVGRHEVVRLPGAGEPRVLLVAEVEVGGQRWTVGCTHLATRRSVASRQLLAAFDALGRWPAPRVLSGDLNLTAPEVLPWSTAEGYQLVDGPPTHSTRQPRVTRRVDHVLLHGARADRAVVLDLPASDHRAVVADLTTLAGDDRAGERSVVLEGR